MSTIVSQRERNRAQQILRTLNGRLSIREEKFATLVVANETRDPFKVLVMTVLTQNCTDVAALRAYRRLHEKIGVSAEQLSTANVRRIERAIRQAGLYKQKAKGIHQFARIINERYSGKLDPILRGDLDEALAELQQLPQIGPKTADVLLSVFGRPTVSVDTHVNRVSKRLGLAKPKDNYERTRSSLMKLFKELDYRAIPLLFMTLGREVCRARRPLCPKCPVERLCPYPRKTKKAAA